MILLPTTNQPLAIYGDLYFRDNTDGNIYKLETGGFPISTTGPVSEPGGAMDLHSPFVGSTLQLFDGTQFHYLGFEGVAPYLLTDLSQSETSTAPFIRRFGNVIIDAFYIQSTGEGLSHRFVTQAGILTDVDQS